MIPVKYEQPIVPFGELERMAAAVAKSGLFGMKTPEQALALMLTAQAEGQHPATITQDYDIIQGRAARKTHSVLARFQSAGGKVEWHELTPTKAEATFSHPAGGSLRIEWTLDMAKHIGLTGKDNWKNYPRAMLRARCIAEGVRAVFPGAIGGMLVAEEAQDMNGIEPEARPAIEMPKARSEPVAEVMPLEPMAPTDELLLSAGEKAHIKAKLTAATLSEDDLQKKFGCTLDTLKASQFKPVKAWIADPTC